MLGLAPSAAAAAVLSETGIRADTLAKITWSLRHGYLPDWAAAVGPSTLMIIDEAGMADTLTLDAAVQFAIDRGASARLVGDDQRLAAIGAGGVRRDIQQSHGALHLAELHRFTDPAEAAASFALRDGDPRSLDFYLGHGRVHVGDMATMCGCVPRLGFRSGGGARRDHDRPHSRPGRRPQPPCQGPVTIGLGGAAAPCRPTAPVAGGRGAEDSFTACLPVRDQSGTGSHPPTAGSRRDSTTSVPHRMSVSQVSCDQKGDIMAEPVHFDLGPDELPAAWFNLVPDMVGAGMQPLPPLHPGTKEPIGPADLAPLFPESLIMQEVSTERWIDIPGPVLDVYRLWRPTPLYRARRLEQALQTPARIYFKYEGTSPTGSHKPNTAIAQVYYNKEAGIRRISTETGAGQWGSALAFACQMFGLESLVYMVKASYQQKPYRRVMMETFGATVHASPSDTTQVGKRVLGDTPDSTGSLGIAISEAVEVAATNADTNYCLGSVLGHVLLHQTVIGLETQKQMEMAGESPDFIIGCVGGGSNYAGFSYPFMADKLAGKLDTTFVATEPAACPTLTRGEFAYDFGDTGEMAPIVPMYTLGHTFVPAPVHAGGLRYHGDAPSLSMLVKHGHMEARAYTQNQVFDAGVQFARAQGIVPAPEPNHAIRAVIDEAIRAREAGESKVILFNLCGHGHFDMQAYDDFLAGRLPEIEFEEAALADGLTSLPGIPVPG